MYAKLFEKYKVKYENETNCRFLTFDLSGETQETLFGYQIEMISNNPRSSIIPLEMRRKDEEVKLYYHVAARVSLKEYWAGKKVSKQEFLELLTDINNIVLESKSLFLNEKNFILHDEFIFVDQKAHTFTFIYLPIELSVDYVEATRGFITDLITKSAVFELQPGDNYLQRVIEFTKLPEFNTDGLNKLLNEIKSENSPVHHKSAASPASREASAAAVPDSSQYAEQAHSYNPAQNNREERNSTGLDGKIFGYDKKKVLVILIFQFLVISIALGLDTIFKGQGMTPDKRYVIIGLFVLVVDLLLFKHVILKMKNSVSKPQVRQHSIERPVHPVNMSKKSISNIEPQSAQAPVQGKDVNADHTVFEQNAAFEAKKDDRNPEIASEQRIPKFKGNIEETVYLSSNDRIEAVLVRDREGVSEKHEIKSVRFIIGRNPEVSDMVINEKPIGRIHAEIILKGNDYFIIDKNSKNGTFLNGNRLTSGEEYKLINKDKILFANVDFEFLKL
ncbi:MAG: FHA domain-containing protein [Clostridia bacterium]|nr:FHA domain-containing protein [Clostridia bacterium]